MVHSLDNLLDEIKIEVCDARLSPPKIYCLVLKKSTNLQNFTVGMALIQGNFSKSQEDLAFSRKGCFGVYGVRKYWDSPLYDGDRVEIYAPLRIDPKMARRKKANQTENARLQAKAKQRVLERSEKTIKLE